MSYLRKARGTRGEQLAEAYLVERGFRVLHRNWNCRLGEIDLILERAGEVRFVEVKYRRTREFGPPETSITPLKLRHLERAIQVWLEKQAAWPKYFQADAIAILEETNQPIEIVWFQGIFG